MPELPEVETTIRNLKKKVLGRTFLDVWSDTPNLVKQPSSFEEFKNQIKNKKIKKIWRRGKNIIFDLSSNLENGERKYRPPDETLKASEDRSQNYSLLIHQKLTGHLLVGKWQMVNGKWQPLLKGFLEEKVNRYIHFIFWLSNDLMLALSDLRKFAKVELKKTKDLVKELEKLGPEPLGKDFTFEKFKDKICLNEGVGVFSDRRSKGRSSQPIKQILMDQNIIAGIGNIYSDEILWEAKIHPLRKVEELKTGELIKIYQAIKKILKQAIKKRGTSISDYRDPEGKSGSFGEMLNVYRQEGKKCTRCGTIIKKLKLGGRSAHYCPKCQKLD